MVARVVKDKCTGCAACILVCPNAAITIMEGGKAKVEPLYCISCGNCKQACEHEAIILREGGGGY